MEGTIVSWNKGAERIFGYTGLEAVGESAGILMPTRENRESELLDRLLIDLMTKDPGPLKKAGQLEAESTSIMLGSASVFELFAGVAQSRKAEEEKSKIILSYPHCHNWP